MLAKEDGPWTSEVDSGFPSRQAPSGRNMIATITE